MIFSLLKDFDENDFDDVLQCYQYEKYKRPYIPKIDKYDNWFRYLNNDLHYWFKKNKIEYNIFYESLEEGRWWLDIPNNTDAMLFKLTWM